MAISISLEAAELLEVFQWSGADTEVDTEKKLSKVKEELADILIYALLMGNDLGLDIPEIINAKLADNNRKYPTIGTCHCELGFHNEKPITQLV